MILTHIPLKEATDQSEEQGGKRKKNKNKTVNINDSYEQIKDMIYVTKVRILKINPSKGKLTEVHDLAFLVKSWGLFKSPFPNT